jgi:flagellar basal-body rod protein FlgF
MGETGPITVPPDTQITIGKDGTISTVPTTSQLTAVTVIGRLKLVNPAQAQLVRGDDGLFRSADGKAANADANISVSSGHLEGSNVNAVEAMVNMITLARQFDMQMKMLTTADNNSRQAGQILNVGS